MPFQVTEKPKSLFQKIEYFVSEPGKHYIRFLEPTENASVIKFHYIPRFKTSIACLGDDCPICENNKTLFTENPGKKAKDIAGLMWPSEKYCINVLDRTPVKVCPNTNCQHEVKADLTGTFSAVCPKCNTIVAGVAITISDKVKVFSITRPNAELFSKLELSQLDPEGNPKPITSYDFELLVVAKGDRKEMIPQVSSGRTDDVVVPSEMFFDTSKAIIELTRDEMLEHIKGVTIRDLFAARKTEVTTEPQNVTTELTEDQKTKIAAEVASVLD